MWRCSFAHNFITFKYIVYFLFFLPNDFLSELLQALSPLTLWLLACWMSLKTCNECWINIAWGFLTFLFHFIFIVERDKDFSHQRRHYKEFRFDLTQIPHGEAVTAAEFRIYKDRSYSRFENETIKISIYQIIKEYPNRSLFLPVVL